MLPFAIGDRAWYPAHGRQVPLGGELNAVLDVAAGYLRVPRSVEESKSRCPVARTPLYEIDYPHTPVAVHVCKKCDGLWLDRGELSKIKDVRAGLMDKGELDDLTPVTGVKRKLLKFIDVATEVLLHFD